MDIEVAVPFHSRNRLWGFGSVVLAHEVLNFMPVEYAGACSPAIPMTNASPIGCPSSPYPAIPKDRARWCKRDDGQSI